MKKRLKHYIETLKLELPHCKSNSEYRFLERIITKLEDIVKRGGK